MPKGLVVHEKPHQGMTMALGEQQFGLQWGMDVSRRTVSRRLVDDFSLKARKPAKKPRLTPAMKVKRLGFAKKHAKWTIQQWQQVSFPTNLQYSSSLHAIAISVDPLESDLMNGTPRRAWNTPQASWFGVECQWAERPDCFSYHQERPWMAKSTLTCWRTSWNYIWPSINAKFLCRMVHHVAAPKSLLSFWSRRKFKSWTGLENSPDLNPIENLWTVLKDKVSEKQPASAKELVDTIKAVWVHESSAEYCRSLVESMPKCLEAIIKAKGGPTKYWLFWKFCVESTWICVYKLPVICNIHKYTELISLVNLRFVV